MKDKREGLLIVVSGPSGVGKGVICKALLSRNANMRVSVSATTRSPRPGEVDGQSYFFKSSEEFMRMIDKNEFLEYMHVFGSHYYGTPRAYVEGELAKGHDVILEIDVNGAMKVKSVFPQAVTVFIAPPSMETLKARLVGRGTEDAEAIALRTSEAYDEIERAGEYDFLVINDVLETAIESVETIIAAERMRVDRCPDIITFLQGDAE